MEELKQIFEISPVIVLVVPIVIGLVGIAKGAGLSDRLLPFLSLGIGIALMSLIPSPWQMFLVQGIIAGLMASGLYSGVKAVKE